MIAALLLSVPLLGAVVSSVCAIKSERIRDRIYTVELIAVFALAACAFASNLRGAAIAVGSEGRGLSPALLELCDGHVVIPMRPECESLNAAVAASILMWEMRRSTL